MGLWAFIKGLVDTRSLLHEQDRLKAEIADLKTTIKELKIQAATIEKEKSELFSQLESKVPPAGAYIEGPVGAANRRKLHPYRNR